MVWSKCSLFKHLDPLGISPRLQVCKQDLFWDLKYIKRTYSGPFGAPGYELSGTFVLS